MENEKGLVLTNNKNIFTSLDLEKQENKIKLYNATEECDVLLNDIVNSIIEVKDVYVEEIKKVDAETGELQEKYRTILFDKNGKTYASGAYGVYNSLKRIFTIFGTPDEWDTLKLQVYKRKTSDGKQSLCLKIVE